MPTTDQTPTRPDPLQRLRDEADAAGAPVEWIPGVRAEPALGDLVLASAADPPARAEAAFALEAVFEGFLSHQGRPRLFGSGDEDVALLTGDLLYALGLRAVASAGDIASVRVLADLIGCSAGLASEGRLQALAPLWTAQAVVLGDPPTEARETIPAGFRAGGDREGTTVAASAREAALAAGADGAFDQATEALQLLFESVAEAR